MTHLLEDASGTAVPRTPHPHNGYYPGDFSAVPFELPDLHHLAPYAAYAAHAA